MKFGVHSSSWFDSPDPTQGFQAVKAVAQWAENHSFAWFSVMDHMIQIPGVGAPDEPILEGWTALSALAAVTSRIRLATPATVASYRNPAHLAKIAASVDLISHGRLTLGIGAGFFEDEYKQYGWEFPARPATRIRQMEDAVQLTRSNQATGSRRPDCADFRMASKTATPWSASSGGQAYGVPRSIASANASSSARSVLCCG